jgi:DUF971 family protein
MLGKNTHQCGELLDTLAKLLALKRPIPVKLPTKHTTILPLDYGSHKQKNLAVFICRVMNLLELDVRVYPTERDQMILAKQYLVSNTAAPWDQYCVRHPEGDYTWAALKDLIYSWVGLTKHRTDAAF